MALEDRDRSSEREVDRKIGQDDSADRRAEHYAIALLSVIGAVVVVTLAALLWVSMPFASVWIAAAVVVAVALLGAELIVVRRRHRSA